MSGALRSDREGFKAPLVFGRLKADDGQDYVLLVATTDAYYDHMLTPVRAGHRPDGHDRGHRRGRSPRG